MENQMYAENSVQLVQSSPKKVRNCSIDLFRIVGAIMVVSGHTRPLSDIGSFWGYFTSKVFPGICVPFFICIMGYFYMENLNKGKKAFVPTFTKLLKSYAMWSVIYIAIDLLQGYLTGTLPKYDSVFDAIFKYVVMFFVKGTYYHLWFFPAAIISLCICTFFYKIKAVKFGAWLSVILYVIGLLGCSYFAIGDKILGLSQIINSGYFVYIRRILLHAFPFFMSGYFIKKINSNDRMKNILSKNSVLLFVEVVLTLLFLLEIFLVNKLNLQDNVILTIILYPLLVWTMFILFRNPLPKYTKQASIARDLSSFIYYVHPIMIIIGKIILKNTIGMYETLLFVFTLLTSSLLGLILIKIDNKFINLLYK